MTILNFCCDPQRLVLATDTAVARDGVEGIVGERNKFAVFEDRRLVIASRGAISALDALVKYCDQRRRDFDKLIELPHLVLPRILQRSVGLDSSAAHKWDVFVGGWSEASQRMRAILFQVTRSQCIPGFTAPGASVPLKVLPPVEHPELAAEPYSKDAMFLTMRRQLDAARSAEMIDGGFGGRMVYVTLTADGVDVCEDVLD